MNIYIYIFVGHILGLIDLLISGTLGISGSAQSLSRLKQSALTWPPSCSFLLHSGVMPVSESGAEVAVAGLGVGDPLESPGDVDVELVGSESDPAAFFRSYFFQYSL